MTEDVKRYIQVARLIAAEMDDALTTTDVHDLYDAIEVGRDRLFEMADLIEQLAEREWELFDLITSVYHGKQYYFRQEDGMVYSRDSNQCMSFDQAIDEFCGRLSND